MMVQFLPSILATIINLTVFNEVVFIFLVCLRFPNCLLFENLVEQTLKTRELSNNSNIHHQKIYIPQQIFVIFSNIRMVYTKA